MEHCSLAENTSQAFTPLQHSILAPEDSWKTHTRAWNHSTLALFLPRLCSGCIPRVSRDPSPFSPLLQGLSIPHPQHSKDILPPHSSGGQPQPDALCHKPSATSSTVSQGSRDAPTSPCTREPRPYSPQPQMSFPSCTPVHRTLGVPWGRCPGPSEPSPPAARTAHPRAVPSRQRRRQIVSVLRMRRKVVQTRARLGRSVPGSDPKICTRSSGGSSNKDSGARPAGPASIEGGRGRPPSMRSAASSSSVTPPPPASSGSVSVSGSLSAAPRRCSLAALRRRQPRAGPTPHSRAHTAMAAAALTAAPGRATVPAVGPAHRARRWARPPQSPANQHRPPRRWATPPARFLQSAPPHQAAPRPRR